MSPPPTFEINFLSKTAKSLDPEMRSKGILFCLNCNFLPFSLPPFTFSPMPSFFPLFFQTANFASSTDDTDNRIMIKVLELSNHEEKIII